MKDQSMQNQVAIVTGATGGIGSAICRRLAQAGAKIVLGYKNKQEEARKLAHTLAGEDHLVLQVAVAEAGDVLLTMGAGDIGSIAQRLPAELEGRA